MITYSDNLADKYNEYHSLSSNIFDLQLQKIKGYLNTSETTWILDVGCGSGRLLKPLIENRISNVIGVEKSEAMFQQCCENTKQLAPGSLSYNLVNLDFNEFLLQNGSSKLQLDGAYFSFSLHQIGKSKLEQLELLERTFSVLKPHSQILVITVTERQFEDITINQLIPSVSKIDKERFLTLETYKNFFNVSVIEDQRLFYPMTVAALKERIQNRYISTLQLVPKEEIEFGLNQLSKYPEHRLLDYSDCYSYLVLSKK